MADVRGSLFLAATIAVAAACGAPPEPQVPPPPPGPGLHVEQQPHNPPPVAKTPTAPSKQTPSVSATSFGPKLKALGLDVKKLPKLDTLKKDQLRLVMDYISEATGAACTDCHASENDLAKETPKKNQAMRMWNDWARNLAMSNGDPVFCDSCHHGKLHFLERDGTLAGWMNANFIDQMKRTDNRQQSCRACHGEPFNQYFLEEWEKPLAAAEK